MNLTPSAFSREYNYPFKLCKQTLVVMPALLTLVYTVLLTPVVNVIPLVNGLLPTGVQVDATVNGLPVNFIVAIGILAAAFLASIALGVAWRGGVWLACAVIFYII